MAKRILFLVFIGLMLGAAQSSPGTWQQSMSTLLLSTRTIIAPILTDVPQAPEDFLWIVPIIAPILSN